MFASFVRRAELEAGSDTPPRKALPLRTLARACASSLFALLIPLAASAQGGGHKGMAEGNELTLVRVNFTTEIHGENDSLGSRGKLVADYQPTIIQVFQSTGVVFDERGHIITFLGYRWVDMQGPAPHIEIFDSKGEKHAGQLIGIDQNIGVAVVKSMDGRLRKTPICEGCEIKGGFTVVTPVAEDAGFVEFQQVQIVSTPKNRDAASTGFWAIKINRPLPGVGEPLLDLKHRVLGFVFSQKAEPDDPTGANTIMYHPMSQLMASAEKILKVGGDIRTGWLGVMVNTDPGDTRGGVVIESVLDDGPAQRAGVLAGDVIARFNGRQIREPMQFIRMVQDTPIGTSVPLEVMRAGNPMVLHALIEGRKAPENRRKLIFDLTDMIRLAGNPGYTEADTSAGASFWGGLQTVQLTPQLADALHAPGQTGLLVLNVEPRTSFGMAGVQVGDVIVSVDGHHLLSPQTFFSYLRARSRNAHTMILHLLRKGAERRTTVEFPQSPAPKK